MTAADPSDRHNALTYARAHLKTHIAWRDYLRAGGELPHDKIGDLEHQEKAIRELNTICKVLRVAPEDAGQPCPWCGRDLVLDGDVCRYCGKDPEGKGA